MTKSLAYLYSEKNIKICQHFSFCLKTDLKLEVGPLLENRPYIVSDWVVLKAIQNDKIGPANPISWPHYHLIV